MGLIDRDYMHERHRKTQANSAGRLERHRIHQNKWPMMRIACWTFGVCSLIYLGTKYVILPVGTAPFPVSGQVLWYVPQVTGAGAPFSVTAPDRGDDLYAVRVTEVGTGRIVGLVPLRRGETVKVEVPLGQYEMMFASGSRWYGPEKLFGFSGEKKKAVKTFNFYRSGNVINGNSVNLTNRIDGNLQTRPMMPFDK
jgi:hypothetical protein